jgi:hypothetical protein
MLIGYGGYTLSFSISGSAGGSAFLTPASGLGNGRTGDGTSMQWISGAQTTASFTQLTVGVASPFAGESSPAWGVVGVCNVQGLPVGTKVTINGATQRLVADKRGQLNAWALPFANGTSLQIKFFNDVNGVASIAASTVFAVGEIFVGRLISLPTLDIGSNPSRTLVGIPADSRSGRNQNWPLMRNPYWQIGAQLGLFTRAQAKGGLASSLVSGGNPAGVIDIETLMMLLSQTTCCAICDAPSAARDLAVVTNGIRFDQNFMQNNWMLARPSSIGSLSESSPPYWTWNPQFSEAL